MIDSDNPAAIFGAKLRAARSRAGLSQGELAERIQSTQAYISRAERGLENPPLLTCILLATAVDCSPRVAEAIDFLFKP
jgi:transcriptional regulator with XRE-family HTH domain